MPIRRVDTLDAPSGEKVTVGSGNNTFTLPTTRGTDNYVLTRDNSIGTGGTTWKETTLPPTISSITYPTESGAVSTALQASGGSDNNIKTLTITNGGTGYSGSGTLSATGGGGNGFAGTYTVSGGAINSVTITDAGQEYTSAPTIVVSGSTSGTSAVITASILETLLINGQDFTSTVTVTISGNSVSSSAFAGTVSVNGTGTVITCSNVTKRAAADNYTLTVTNTTGLNTTTTVNFNADPSFSTASGSLGTVITGTAMSTKTITAGSSVSWYEGTPTMPTWMSHFSDGATGTSQNLAGVPTIGSGNSEIQNFNIIIRDSENQSHNRDFSLTVNTAPTGGTIASSPPTGYRVHVWSTVGTNQGGQFTLYGTTLCDILVIAGGGGGGNGSANQGEGGGGGAGGLVYYHQKSLSAGSYDIIVGDKGAGSGGATARGTSGNPSRFGSLTEAVGGGGGGSRNSAVQSGLSGGSGGGGGQRDTNTNNFGSGTANQGNNGGNGFEGTQMSGGGGGGARAAGTSSPSTGVGGAGGFGYTEGDSNSVYNFTTSSALSSGIPANFQGTGSNQQYAGGGGGGGQSTPANGNNGGGNGATNNNAGTDASTYGSGGGGQGGDGKQGIVIVRYAI